VGKANEAPLCDIGALRLEVAAHRGDDDDLARAQESFGDDLAAFVARHFPAGERAAAGRALLIAAGALGGLVVEGVERPEVLMNILGYAGDTMIELAQDGKDG
jgi:hypothetical protein